LIDERPQTRDNGKQADTSVVFLIEGFHHCPVAHKQVTKMRGMRPRLFYIRYEIPGLHARRLLSCERLLFHENGLTAMMGK